MHDTQRAERDDAAVEPVGVVRTREPQQAPVGRDELERRDRATRASRCATPDPCVPVAIAPPIEMCGSEPRLCSAKPASCSGPDDLAEAQSGRHAHRPTLGVDLEHARQPRHRHEVGRRVGDPVEGVAGAERPGPGGPRRRRPAARRPSTAGGRAPPGTRRCRPSWSTCRSRAGDRPRRSGAGASREPLGRGGAWAPQCRSRRLAVTTAVVVRYSGRRTSGTWRLTSL